MRSAHKGRAGSFSKRSKMDNKEHEKMSKVERWIIEICPERGLDTYGSIKFGASLEETIVSGWGFSPNSEHPVLRVITPWATETTVPYTKAGDA